LGWVISCCSASCLPEMSAAMWLQRHLGTDWGLLWMTKNVKFCLHSSLIMWKVLLHAINVIPSFTYILKEVVLWIVMALKNPSILAAWTHELLNKLQINKMH
jgi:hypothetical protein